MTTTMTGLGALEAKLDSLTAQVAMLTDLAAEQAVRRRQWDDLLGDASPLGRDVLAVVLERLDELDRRGYFTFARNGLGVLDEVVTSFTEDDMRQLGENVVLILETVKEVTQPEVMLMLRRTMHTVRENDDLGGDVSLLRLLRQMRDPDVKRGLARLLAVLRSMGEVPAGLVEERPTPTPKEG